MKIQLSGAQGVGKTTLINLMREDPYFKDFSFNVELARTLSKEGYKVDREIDDEAQNKILDKTLELLKKEGDNVYDRSILDAFVYTTYYFEKQQLSYYTYTRCKDAFESFISYLDFLFIIKPEFELKADGFRSTDTKYQKEINDLFELIIKTYKISVIYLTGTPEQRINQIKEVLDGVSN